MWYSYLVVIDQLLVLLYLHINFYIGCYNQFNCDFVGMNMITGHQIRAARALLNLSAPDSRRAPEDRDSFQQDELPADGPW